MSNRPRVASGLFVYYCALSGGWAAFLGFLLGVGVAPENPLGRAGILGMFFGLLVSSALGCLDGLCTTADKPVGIGLLQGVAAAPVGALAGLLGGILGHALANVALPLQILAWGLTGALIGLSLSVYEFVDGAIRQTVPRSARRKLIGRLVSGLVGGLAGGMLAMLLGLVITRALRDRAANWLWSPRALAFVAAGMCISVGVALVRVRMKDD